MVIVDTSVFSLFLRREQQLDDPVLTLFLNLFDKDQIVLLGIVYQEILSGVRSTQQFERLEAILRGFPIELAEREDHQLAAEHYNICRTNGIQGSSFDYLICAMAVRRDLPILTTDQDFQNYAKHIPITLYSG